jgi:hypothetical protein
MIKKARIVNIIDNIYDLRDIEVVMCIILFLLERTDGIICIQTLPFVFRLCRLYSDLAVCIQTSF